MQDDGVGRVIEKITQEEAERQGREEIKRLAKEEAEALAKTYAKRSARLLSYGKWISRAGKAIKPLLIYSPLVIALLIGLLHFVNLSMLVAPIEKLATASLGEVGAHWASACITMAATTFGAWECSYRCQPGIENGGLKN